jgi:predicted RNase H-like HicB family nuclease
MTTYTARYERDDEGNWLAELVEEPRIHTWGRSLHTARAHIKEAAELWFDSDDLEVVDQFPKWVSRPLARAVPAREKAEKAAEAAAEATVNAVRSLTEQGLSRRDVADLLGVSYQRVQQLVAEAS